MDNKVKRSKFKSILGMQDEISTKKLCTLHDAWRAWENGEKFPIAILGDSTFDGNDTTGWIENTIGTDHQPTNAWSTKLQVLIQEYSNNNNARIYNAGFSGEHALWGYENIDKIFSGVYADTKIMGIGFGINDRLLYTNTQDYANNFRQNIKNIIEWCYEHSIQPFLFTSQATLEPATSFSEYTLRTSENINSVANDIKKELALEYGIELIDLNFYTSKFMLDSSSSLDNIINNGIHFKDLGAQYEAEVVFSYLCPRVIITEGKEFLGFNNQKSKGIIDETKIIYNKEGIVLYGEKGKAYALFDKKNKDDEQVIDYLVLNLNKDNYLYSNEILLSDRDLKARNDDERPYVVINDINNFILKHTFESNNLETSFFKHYKLTRLNYGLNRIKVMSGKRTKVCYGGLLIENPENLNKTVNVGIFKDINSNYHMNFNEHNTFYNYAEDNVVFKLKLDTNAKSDLFIPIFDTINTTIFLKAIGNCFEIWKAKRSSLNSLVDNMENWEKLCPVSLNINALEKLKAGVFICINNLDIKIYSDLNMKPFLICKINTVLGGGHFCNFITSRYFKESEIQPNQFINLIVNRLG
jgi:lysophospholipase L1-like esterase